MKLLAMHEFHDRVQAVQRATRIFGHMTDQDITLAFQAYQEILAETQRPATLTTVDHGGRSPTIIDEIGRPQCPDCHADMMIRRVPENREGIKAQFVCSNKNCDLVLDSPMSPEEIIRDLQATAAKKKEA